MRGDRLVELVEVIARLQAECDWKAAQTHRSLSRYLLEEAYETLDAIDVQAETGDGGHLREELGDVLLQVYLHAEIASGRGDFDVDDVAADLTAKMVRRNPHVFGDDAVRGTVSGPASVNELWESVKATEKPRASVLDGLPATLPALLYADKVLDRLARAGRPASTPDGAGTGIGERLLAVVAEARAAGVDPEQALRDAVHRLL